MPEKKTDNNLLNCLLDHIADLEDEERINPFNDDLNKSIISTMTVIDRHFFPFCRIGHEVDLSQE